MTITPTWVRWAAMHGVPRVFLAVQARRGEPLARLLVGPQRGGDPYPLIEQIRARGRLTRTPFVSVTADHELCRTILRDDRFGVTTPTNMDLPRPITWLIRHTDPQLPNPAEPPSMLQVDPPDHSRYRRPVAHAFTPRTIDTLRTRIIEVTNDLLDRLESVPRPDLITDFAAPLPAEIIAEVLGVPEELRPQMLNWGDRGAPLLDIGVSWKTFRRAMQSLRESDQDFGNHIDRLRSAPSDDVFSQVIRDGDLNRRELGATAALLAGAGFETTVNLIGNAIVLLLHHRDQLAMLREDPELWPGAVEEVLRIDSPVQMSSRTAACDLELPATTSRLVRRSRCCSAAPTVIPACSPIPRGSTSPELTPKIISPSAAASTRVWGPAWPAWRPPSRCAHCSNGFPRCGSTEPRHHARWLPYAVSDTYPREPRPH